MHTLLKHSLPELYPGQLHLVLAERQARRELVDALIARLALGGAVQVLDGGNSFRAHHLARAIRCQTSHWEATLGNIHIARAFTCYQMATLLMETPGTSIPTLVLDLLATFQDESVASHKRRGLLRVCLAQLQRLSQQAPIAVSTAPALEGGGNEFVRLLKADADQVWQLVAPPSPAPWRLF